MAHFYLCYSNKNDSYALKKNCTIFISVATLKARLKKENNIIVYYRHSDPPVSDDSCQHRICPGS